MLVNVLNVLDKTLKDQETLLELYRNDNSELRAEVEKLKQENAELKAGIEKFISACEERTGEQDVCS